MKQTILFICLCVLFVVSGCHTSKKIVSSTAETITSSETQYESTSSETYNFADKTKKQDIEINYFKIEFYPPGPDDNPDTITNNSTFPENLLSNIGSSNPNKPPNNKGSIKSIEGYIVKEKIEQSGVNESTEIAQVNRNTEKNEDINRQDEIKEQPAPDPYRWRYILAIIVLVILAGIGAYLALWKTKPIIALISFVKKLF
ncbi:MAG: hypothetical protein LBH30_02355 [Prevotellaceae bacterium]|jgi:hypothetical protein|nr:hypothetical protein [Prevotellaceae bacterium]